MQVSLAAVVPLLVAVPVPPFVARLVEGRHALQADGALDFLVMLDELDRQAGARVPAASLVSGAIVEDEKEPEPSNVAVHDPGAWVVRPERKDEVAALRKQSDIAAWGVVEFQAIKCETLPVR